MTSRGAAMLHAFADETVIGYLGRALSLELSAVQQYSTQARLVATWGLSEASERLREEAREELGHAERIIARMLATGVAPNASQLRSARVGSDLRELLVQDRAFEHDVIKLYTDAVRHCAAIADHDNRLFFQALLEEEQRHSAELEEWLSTVESREQRTRGGEAESRPSKSVRREF